MKIQFHTIDDAPEAAKTDLQNLEKAYGVVPNLFAGLAASPAAVKSYMAIAGNMKEHGVLNPVEQQVVYITVSAQNGCDYCVAAHSTGAGKVKMPDDVLAALRAQEALPDVKLDALRTFALAMLDQRGYMSDEDLAAFAKAGYGQAHVLEVITIMAHKTMSNYFNHIAKTPLDAMFKLQEWQTTAR
ncbi:hypothetical protein MNBD_ALPHA08-1745 [hydrothermal vent metagenome]|uniref:Carboxymuconolactone decarboxylase-like domain-containing protein n=1 Tax=hydrothermal vent metagenome TaxID=652676 RepID=A0A3B0T8F0_9ZZZZ